MENKYEEKIFTTEKHMDEPRLATFVYGMFMPRFGGSECLGAKSVSYTHLTLPTIA